MTANELETHLYERVKELRILQQAHEESEFHRSCVTPILNATTSIDKCLQWMSPVKDKGSLPDLVRKMRTAEKDFFKVSRRTKSDPLYLKHQAHMTASRLAVDEKLKQFY